MLCKNHFCSDSQIKKAPIQALNFQGLFKCQETQTSEKGWTLVGNLWPIYIQSWAYSTYFNAQIKSQVWQEGEKNTTSISLTNVEERPDVNFRLYFLTSIFVTY